MRSFFPFIIIIIFFLEWRIACKSYSKTVLSQRSEMPTIWGGRGYACVGKHLASIKATYMLEFVWQILSVVSIFEQVPLILTVGC